MDYTGEDFPKSLKRNPDAIFSKLQETKDGRVVALTDLHIMLPEHYINKDLCRIDTMIHTMGIFCIIDPASKQYAVFSIPTRVILTIGELETITYNEEVYRVIKYERGDTIIANTKIVQREQDTYWLFDYFIALANVPWYMNYLDVVRIYDQDDIYAGRLLPPNSQIVEMMLSNIARDARDSVLMYRTTLKQMDDIYRTSPQWVPLRNITLGAIDTYNKVMGSYASQGETAALAERSKEMTNIEKVLRS